MKWIKYQVVCNTINVGTEDEPIYEPVLLNKKVGYNNTNLAIAEDECYNGYEIVEDEKSYEEKPLAVELGGTGANTPEGALENLGAFPKAGGTITGPIVLTEGIHYGTELPEAGTKGRIFFKVVG